VAVNVESCRFYASTDPVHEARDIMFSGCMSLCACQVEAFTAWLAGNFYTVWKNIPLNINCYNSTRACQFYLRFYAHNQQVLSYRFKETYDSVNFISISNTPHKIQSFQHSYFG